MAPTRRKKVETTEIEKSNTGESLALVFKQFNRFILILWRLGLGAWINIWPQGFGRIMVITHTGRNTRTRRQTPVNYAVINGEVYCTASRGVHSDWYQNIVMNPHVEIWLPDSWWAGTAEDVSDQEGSLEKMRMVIMACGFVGRMFGLDACAMPDEDFRNATRDFRLIHIRRKQARTGRNGPGDLAWVWPLTTLLLILWLFSRWDE